ncbi:PREDICTED: uncharacterized protein LOC105451490 isoform X2 [Wasmannia auropunctata]|nr:PREDICTED: uncharacterized protein LOC105451490 isoform X2 [Wasmannia auropunctata]
MSLFYSNEQGCTNEFYGFKRLWAHKSDNQWVLLSDSSSNIFDIPRGTVPVLQSCSFKTKLLKLEFWNNSILNSEINGAAIMLIGTSEFILPRNPKQSLNHLLDSISQKINHNNPDIFNTITNLGRDPHLDILHLQENFDEYCIIFKSDVIKSFYKSEFYCKKVSQMTPEVLSFNQGHMHRFLKNYLNNEKCVKDIKPSLDESKKLSSCNFSELPDKIIVKIMNNLDMISLSCMSRVNKRFNDLSWDSQLYKCLNFWNIYLTCMNNNLSHNQLFRLLFTQMSTFTTMGSGICWFSYSKFREFLKTCCENLTHLRFCPQLPSVSNNS